MILLRKIITAFVFISLFIQCEEDNTNHQPDKNILEAFYNKYPTAQGVIWSPNVSFEKVNFFYDNFIAEAWYSAEAHWLCSQKWVATENIPSLILQKFQKNPYKPASKAKILEQAFCPVSYLLSVEGTPEHIFCFSDNGRTDKEITAMVPSAQLPTFLTDFIYKKYPATIIWKGEKLSNGKLNVLLFTPQQISTIHFNKTNNWLYSSSPLPFQQLPAPVAETFKKSNYKEHTIQKITLLETPASCFYTFVLEKNKHEEIHLSISTEGQILSDEIFDE